MKVVKAFIEFGADIEQCILHPESPRTLDRALSWKDSFYHELLSRHTGASNFIHRIAARVYSYQRIFIGRAHWNTWIYTWQIPRQFLLSSISLKRGRMFCKSASVATVCLEVSQSAQLDWGTVRAACTWFYSWCTCNAVGEQLATAPLALSDTLLSSTKKHLHRPWNFATLS